MILNRNREVAKIVPITPRASQAAGLVGTAEVRGDFEAPIPPAVA